MTRKIYIADRIHSPAVGTAHNALVVESGRVVSSSTADVARRQFPDAEIIDFESCTITPGLTDSHIHLVEWAVARTQVDLARANSMEEAAATVAAAAPVSGWIMGRGWNPHRWGGDYPSCAVLDRVAGSVPVVLQSHDMHALWLNTRALERIGIANVQSDPEGGRILRDAAGHATGVLLENAAQLVVPHLPRYDVESILELIVDAQRELHSYGITGIHSFPGIHLKDPDPLPALQLLRERGALTLRILQHIALERLDDAIRLGLRSGFGDEWIRIGGVKMFLDGALGSRTAWMREPYEASSDCGVQVMTGPDFRETVARAAAHGIASVVHAIGDAAVALAFDVLTDTAVRVASLPHRVEHVQCLPPDFGSWLSQGVICSVQPSHLMSDWRAADAHWGARSAQTYAFRYMLEHGATLAFGSDAPVEPADARHGLYAAVARQDLAGEPADGWHAAQRLKGREALDAYTTGAALAAGLDPARANLAPGALADFVAWQQDPLEIEARALLSLEPAATIVAGQIVFGG